MDYTISYYGDDLQAQIADLPDTLAAKYVVLTRRMITLGPNLGEPHTKAFGDGLFELRFFIKKSARTPVREREIAENRMKEIKRANTRSIG